MTITTILLDLCRVILFPVDISYKSELNFLYKKLVGDYDYSFKNNFRIDTQMINYLQILKNKKDLYMFTSGTIQNSPEIKDMLDSIFIKIFSADEMGYRKNDPKVFLTIAKLINNKPQEILRQSPEIVAVSYPHAKWIIIARSMGKPIKSQAINHVLPF